MHFSALATAHEETAELDADALGTRPRCIQLTLGSTDTMHTPTYTCGTSEHAPSAHLLVNAISSPWYWSRSCRTTIMRPSVPPERPSGPYGPNGPRAAQEPTGYDCGKGPPKGTQTPFQCRPQNGRGTGDGTRRQRLARPHRALRRNLRVSRT